MLVPITPPPTITTSAVGGRVREVDDLDKRPIPSEGPDLCRWASVRHIGWAVSAWREVLIS
ncbi:hypothetical protein GCM10010217_44500 [Streptomyces tubercidicus]